MRVLLPGGLLFVAEVDRGCRMDDARRFVERWELPRPLRRAALPLFRTYVAGNGFDLDDARALAEGLPLDEVSVARIPGTPGLLIRGRRALAT